MKKLYMLFSYLVVVGIIHTAWYEEQPTTSQVLLGESKTIPTIRKTQPSYWDKLTTKGTTAKENLKNQAYWANQKAAGYKDQAIGAYKDRPQGYWNWIKGKGTAAKENLKNKAYWTGQKAAGYKDQAVGALETRYKDWKEQISKKDREKFDQAFNNLKKRLKDKSDRRIANEFSKLFERDAAGFLVLTPQAEAQGWEQKQGTINKHSASAVNPDKSNENIFLYFDNKKRPGFLFFEYQSPRGIITTIREVPGKPLSLSHTNLLQKVQR